MAARTFDRKFGAEFLESLPSSPGVYLVYNSTGHLIYVGKAINLKRRLAQYRNTTRRKNHRRMRGIVKDADRIEIQCAENHLASTCSNKFKVHTVNHSTFISTIQVN